jgi:hypothetical protein
VIFLDPYKAEAQFGQLPPPRHLDYDVTSVGDDLGAPARDWVSERTDYPRHVAQLALVHEADGGVVNVDFDWRPKKNVSNYASAERTAMSDKRAATSAIISAEYPHCGFCRNLSV